MAAAVGVIAQVVAPIVINVVTNVLTNLVSDMLSNFLGGAPNAGGSDGICKHMQGHEPTDVRNAAINLMNGAHVDSLKDAMDQLCKNFGMPKFVRDDLNNSFDQVLKEHHQPCNPATQNALNGCTAQDTSNKIRQTADQLVQYVEDMLKDRLEGATRGAGASSGKKISSKSWIAALAEALGKVQGQKVGEMVNLTDRVSEISENQVKLSEEGKRVDVDDKQKMQNHNSEKSQLAAEMTKAQSELQGVQQEYKLISETTSTLLKTIGETLSGMARKQ